MGIELLNGLVLTQITGVVGDEKMFFVSECGRRFKMYHLQDCCESVSVEDICGEITNLLGMPILRAFEATGSTDESESSTWTFYHIATMNGWVTIRWYGNSNGYYSESVYFEEIT